jgi:hypothetical protein
VDASLSASLTAPEEIEVLGETTADVGGAGMSWKPKVMALLRLPAIAMARIVSETDRWRPPG